MRRRRAPGAPAPFEMRRERTLLSRYLDGRDAAFRKSPFVRATARRLRALHARGIRTVPALIAAYPRLARRTQAFAVWVLGVMGDRRAVPLLVRVFREQPTLRGEAGTALGLLGGRRAYAFAVRTLRAALAAEEADERLVVGAAILLVHMPSEHDRLLADPGEPVLLLRDLLVRGDLPSLARGQAASGLGHILGDTDRRRRRWRAAARAVLDALSDGDPYVRHEAAHAAGDLRLAAARARLSAMARNDPGKCGLGLVAREAKGALFAIEHGDWPAWWWDPGEPD